MKIYLIRHLKTKGNLERRYIGRTDEPIIGLDPREHLIKGPEISRLYTSPMRRCLETAKLYYPQMPPVVIEGLRETDFGKFEGKTYEELKKDPDYTAFVNGSGFIPEGEAVGDFKKRCIDAFDKVVGMHCNEDPAAIISHGGVIMSIMECLEINKKDFYQYHVKNGCGFELEYNYITNSITIIRELCL